MKTSPNRGHIFILGFMGSGKSTVGVLLAEGLGLQFVDLDDLIEQESCVSIPEIFRDRGEDYFRRLETKVLKTQSELPRSVIGLGGGAFSSLCNRDIVQDTGLSIWLKVSLETACERCLDTERPLAQDSNLFARLFNNRQPYYRKAAIHVETTGRSPSEIVAEISARLKEFPHTLG